MIEMVCISNHIISRIEYPERVGTWMKIGGTSEDSVESAHGWLWGLALGLAEFVSLGENSVGSRPERKICLKLLK